MKHSKDHLDWFKRAVYGTFATDIGVMSFLTFMLMNVYLLFDCVRLEREWKLI